jgi:hypothetical protein
MATPKPNYLLRLIRLERRLNRAVQQLEAIAANRDPITGTFRPGTSIDPKALRAAWGIDTQRAAFKQRLIAAINARK